MNRCKNNIFCKYYTRCVDNTPLCNTKVCIVTHVVQITHKVQDYTLICCIACTVWYRVCQITTQYSVNFCLLSGKFTPGRKIYTDAVLGVLDKYEVWSYIQKASDVAGLTFLAKKVGEKFCIPHICQGRQGWRPCKFFCPV